MNEQLNRYRDILYSCDLFQGIDPRLMPGLLKSLDAKLVSYEKGAPVVRLGETFSRMGLVLEGMLATSFINADGVEANLYMHRPGMTYAAPMVYLGDCRSDYHVFAERFSVVLSMDITCIRDDQPHTQAERIMQTNMMADFARRCMNLYKKMEIYSQKRIRSRLKIYLMGKMDGGDTVILPVSRTELASYLGVERTALSRELASMQQDGLIAVDKRRVKLLDREFFQFTPPQISSEE